MASGAPGVVSSSFGRVANFCFFREIQYIYVDTHICMSTHPYKYIYIYTNFMSTSENLSRLDLEIYKVGKNWMKADWLGSVPCIVSLIYYTFCLTACVNLTFVVAELCFSN
jgi:hypothetical protein